MKPFPMFLTTIKTALPDHCFTQAECMEQLGRTAAYGGLKERSRTLVGKILGNGDSGIDTRHLCIDGIERVCGRSAQELNELFEREAADLAGKALVKALDDAGLAATDLDALLVCTCTGYLCPGVTSHISERLGLRDSAYLQDLVGLGCGAAIPMMRSAQGFLAAHPGAVVATVAVEVCSAAFYTDDDAGVLISLCLFGDGSAAAIWTDEAVPGRWQAGNFSTVHVPEQREKIRFVNAGGRLKNQLHRAVPGLAAEAVSGLYERRTREPDRVLAHSGGRDVIEALEEVLPHRLDDTREVLRHCGNMSSPSVLFALERAVEEPGDDGCWWLTAFGAGFAAHACEIWR